MDVQKVRDKLSQLQGDARMFQQNIQILQQQLQQQQANLFGTQGAIQVLEALLKDEEAPGLTLVKEAEQEG